MIKVLPVREERPCLRRKRAYPLPPPVVICNRCANIGATSSQWSSRLKKDAYPSAMGAYAIWRQPPTYLRCKPKRPTWKRWNGCSASSWSTSDDLPSARISARFNGRQRIEVPPGRASSRRPGLCGHGGGVRANKLVDRWLVFATQRVRQLGLDRRNDPHPVEYKRAIELDQTRARPDFGNGSLTGIDSADADERECALDAYIALRQHPRCE